MVTRSLCGASLFFQEDPSRTSRAVVSGKASGVVYNLQAACLARTDMPTSPASEAARPITRFFEQRFNKREVFSESTAVRGIAD